MDDIDRLSGNRFQFTHGRIVILMHTAPFVNTEEYDRYMMPDGLGIVSADNGSPAQPARPDKGPYGFILRTVSVTFITEHFQNRFGIHMFNL